MEDRESKLQLIKRLFEVDDEEAEALLNEMLDLSSEAKTSLVNYFNYLDSFRKK